MAPNFTCLLLDNFLDDNHHKKEVTKLVIQQLLKAANKLNNRPIVKKINRQYGFYLFKKGIENFNNGIKEKMREALSYLEETDDDEMITNAKWQAYSYLMGNKNVPSSRAALLCDENSYKLFKRAVVAVYKPKAKEVSEKFDVLRK